MAASGWRRGAGVLVLATAVLASAGSAGALQLQYPRSKYVPLRPPAPAVPKFEPKFEAVAETRLLMEGLAQPNYDSLGKFLTRNPGDPETWTFARGQAILIAETGNLLLLRPPRNQGRDTWMKEAMDMRQAATAVARAAGSRDLEKSRAALANLTTACNHCHQTFRIPVRVGPDKSGTGAERDAE
jgi:hypothetical protein